MEMVAGAAKLDWLIRSHQQWREAGAVRAGQQPSRDPDAHCLIEMVGGGRVYRSADGSTWSKMISDDWWRREAERGTATG
jgi:hypothetical protein